MDLKKLRTLPDEELLVVIANIKNEVERRSLMEDDDIIDTPEGKVTVSYIKQHFLEKYSGENIADKIVQMVADATKLQEELILDAERDIVTEKYVGITEIEFWKCIEESVRNEGHANKAIFEIALKVKKECYRKVLIELIQNDTIYSYYIRVFIRHDQQYHRIPQRGLRTLGYCREKEIKCYSDYFVLVDVNGSIYNEQHQIWVNHQNREVTRYHPDYVLRIDDFNKEDSIEPYLTYDPYADD